MNLQNQIDYLREYDLGDMFDECSVPYGLDMARVRGAIVMRCGLMMPLFSEPLTQRAATQQFFFENQWNFEHILNVLKAQYSPIENVAEVREEITTTSGSDELRIDRDSSEKHTGTDARTIQDSGTTDTQESGTTTTERKISAENISTYSPDNEEIITHGKGEEITHGKKTEDSLVHGHEIARDGSDVHSGTKQSETKYSVNRHGNIGVTTNQDMINQELDLLIRFNAYRFIADLYEKELMLGVY